jgi:hypothetical protein
MPPTYRERLRVEGAFLAGCGVAGSGALLAGFEEARRGPTMTAAQLAVVALALGALAPRSARKALDRAEPIPPGGEGSGEPTPLWHVPLVVGGLVAAVVLPRELGAERAGWDAAVRVTAGCALVGLTQAVLIERVVAADERRTGRSYLRMPGSRLGRGTRLGWLTATPRA